MPLSRVDPKERKRFAATAMCGDAKAMEIFMQHCFFSAEILLPRFRSDPEKMKKWACVACDQYTSEPEYWERVERFVGDSESTLRVTLPEIWLDEADERIPGINCTMQKYLNDLLEPFPDSMIYLERRLKSGRVRRGIIGAVDLECYDYTKGARSLVRATEGTVLERIPPRVKIREGAPIELPHIMILIDDPKKTVIEPIDHSRLERAYDFELMENSGRATGYFLGGDEQKRITAALEGLSIGDEPFLFAMGDGNHSLASAKALWERIKPTLSADEREKHPARFALAEIVNIHDEALEFEPIYRVLFDVDPEDVLKSLKKYAESLPKNELAPQTIAALTDKGVTEIVIDNPTSFLPVGTLQGFIDAYAKEHEARVDYIHGTASVKKLISESSVGFIFRGMEKSELFPTVAADGALVRKTFSMGCAEDKRFYLEARRIKI